MAQTQEEVLEEKRNWHWRNSMRPARFLSLDARAAIPWALVLVQLANPFVWAFAIIMTAVFLYLENQGLTFPAAMRTFRVWILGQRRPAWMSLRRRRFIDYG